MDRVVDDNDRVETIDRVVTTRIALCNYVENTWIVVKLGWDYIQNHVVKSDPVRIAWAYVLLHTSFEHC